MLQPKTLKLRIYPNELQKTCLDSYFKARKWAYELGIHLYHQEMDQYKHLIELNSKLKDELPRPQWKNKNFLSKFITSKKQEVKKFYETHDETSFHEHQFLLTTPRCILTQGLDDYQKALNKFFDHLKKKKSDLDSKTGVPRSDPLFKKKTFRFQIDKPLTNMKHVQSWLENKLRIGDLVLRYKDPTALPDTVPDLVTIQQNGYGQYFATFLSSETRKYKNETHESKRLFRQKSFLALKQLVSSEQRQLGYDLNVNAEFFYDNHGLSFSLSEFFDKKKYEMKLARLSRYHSRTKRFNFKNGTPASNRSIKLRKRLFKVQLDRENHLKDYQEKLTRILALFYPNQAREGLKVKDMIMNSGKKKNGKRIQKRYNLSRNLSRVAIGKQRLLMEQKLHDIHGENNFNLITLDTYELSTKCCSNCKEERLHVERGLKVWQCPYCLNTHIRDENAAKNILEKGFGRDEKSLVKKASWNSEDKSLDEKSLENLKSAQSFLEFHPKTGFPMVRSSGLRVGRRRRFISLKNIAKFKSPSFTFFEKNLFEKLELIGNLKLAIDL